MERKGQAAMEFLMTYGWAILAAIIAIGVLAYFGVFSPGKFVAGAATMNAPFGVNAHNVLASSTTANFDMIQNSGDTIQNVVVDVTGTGSSAGITCTYSVVGDWNSGIQKSIPTLCSGGTLTAGQTFTGDVKVTYTKAGSTLTLQSTGTIRDSIQ